MTPTDKIHSSWKPIRELLDEDEKLKYLNQKILPNCKFYPAPMDIFNVFQMPVEDIKVVILGQDPYPNKNQAIGYSFAVNENINKPVSLKIIEKEVGSELNRTLSNWREQGVFLLNTALTVEEKKAGSHLKYWENFTHNVIAHISQRSNAIFILWGKKAQAYKQHIFNSNGRCLEAPHPAAEAYAGGTAGFYGCNHFKITNQILEEQGKKQIIW